MTFETPPRGSGRGRHWRSDQVPPAPRGEYAARYGPVGEPPEYPPDYPGRYDDDSDYPTDPTMPAPLNQVPRPEAGQERRRIVVERANAPRYQDVVVPRVYVEPDEHMDALRQRALRWGIARDVMVIGTLLYLVGSWVLPAVVRLLG